MPRKLGNRSPKGSDAFTRPVFVSSVLQSPCVKVPDLDAFPGSRVDVNFIKYSTILNNHAGMGTHNNIVLTIASGLWE